MITGLRVYQAYFILSEKTPKFINPNSPVMFSKKLFLTLKIIIIGTTLNAQVTCEWEDCSISEAEQANAALYFSQDVLDSLSAVHMFNGKPLNRKNRDRVLLVHEEYVICYDTLIQLPLWTSYLLTSDWADDTRTREDCFRDDPRIFPEGNQETCSYYSGSGYNRGHISPRNDFNRSAAAMHNTYIFTNIVPQKAPHNQSTWRYTEAYVNNLAVELDSIYVVTGILFDYDGNDRPDQRDSLPLISEESPLPIPSHFYKIIVKPYSETEMYSQAFIVPHDSLWRNQQETLNYLEDSCITTIDFIEQISSFNFFWRLENDLEEEIEGASSDELW
jgi:endonuclease G